MWGSGRGWGGMARKGWGKGGQIWEWVLEGPPSSSQGVGRGTQKAVILTNFCFCLAGSRDCQEEGGGGERGRYPGRGRGQGRSQDKRGRESGQTRRDNKACVLVTDRARERGRDPVPRGSQRWPWIRAARRTDSQSSELGNVQTSCTPFLGPALQPGDPRVPTRAPWSPERAKKVTIPPSPSHVAVGANTA